MSSCPLIFLDVTAIEDALLSALSIVFFSPVDVVNAIATLGIGVKRFCTIF